MKNVAMFGLDSILISHFGCRPSLLLTSVMVIVLIFASYIVVYLLITLCFIYLNIITSGQLKVMSFVSLQQRVPNSNHHTGS